MTTNDIVAKYQWKEDIYGVGSSIELKENQTFEYNWQTGLIGGTTCGTWKREGNKISLKSEFQPSQKGTDYEIIKSENHNLDTLKIKVFSSDNEILSFASCVLQLDKKTIAYTSTDLQGIATLPKVTADSLIISFIGYKTIQHPLNKNMTYYELKMKESDEYYEYVTNEIWIYKNDRLYDLSIKKDKFKKNYYERIN